MKILNSKLNHRIGAILISFALFFGFVSPVRADENIKDLENTNSNLESELSTLNNEVKKISSEIDTIASKISNTYSDLKDTREALALAKGEETAQYEAMALRIQYMYENGNTSILEMLLSAGSLAEFLNHAEYYSAIVEYDREVLEQLTATRKRIAENEQKLKKDQKYLNSLQDKLADKEAALNEKISNVSTKLSENTARLEAAKEAARRAEEAARKAAEEARRAEEEAKKEIQPVIPEKPAKNDSSASSRDDYVPSYTATATDLELFAALIECEAGSSNYEGMLAVASVIVNRMKNSHYPDTLRGVIFQSGQFPPATNGAVDRMLARGVKDSCLSVAQDALDGKNNVGDCVSFRSASSGHSGTIIGSNVFF